MHYLESIQFYTYKRKTSILQFKIESSRYDRFEYPFKTDKYINICQWEYIMSKLKNALIGVIKNRDKWENKKNKFVIDELVVSYEFVDKAEGLVDHERMNYEFDWIVKVTINKLTIQDNCSIQESQNSTSSPKKRSSSSSKESNAKNDENLTIDDVDDENFHESKKAKMEEDDDDDCKPSVLQPSNQYNLKPRKEKSDSSRQSSITNWITNRKEKSKPQKSKKEPKPSSSKDAVAQIDKEKLQIMYDFVARSEQEEKKKEERKEELKDYKILRCFDMRDEQIVEIIKDLDYELSNLFENDSGALTLRSSAKINPCEITASNILTERQTMFVLQTIERFHATNDKKESVDDVLHNIALPRVIIELFKKHHNLKTEEAVERIKTQEEKKILFKEEFDESY